MFIFIFSKLKKKKSFVYEKFFQIISVKGKGKVTMLNGFNCQLNYITIDFLYLDIISDR